MSMDYWGIVLYGLDVAKFSLKSEYEREDECVDDFMYKLHENSKIPSGCAFYADGGDQLFFGIDPKYPWEEHVKMTEEEGIEIIKNFMMQYFICTGEEVENEIDYVSSYGGC